MRVLLVVDHYPLSPRVRKVEKIYKSLNYETRILAWDRSEKKLQDLDKRVDVLKQPLGYGNRVGKLLNMTKMKSKIRDEIELYQPSIVHAIDFEMAWLSTQLSQKFGFDLVYEVYDIKFFNQSLVNSVREALEQKVLHAASFVIFASPFFSDYYKKNFVFDKEYFVLNNKPSINQIGKDNAVVREANGKKVISFIGTVRYFDILKNLIYATKGYEGIEVRIYGDGPDLGRIEQIKHENVKTYGRFNVSDLPLIYSETDFVWACYPNNDENVKYAVSNKFFESLYFSKPIFVSDHTCLGDYVTSKNVGIAIDSNNVDSIKSGIEEALSKKFNLPPFQSEEFTWEYESAKIMRLWGKENEK